MTKSKFQTLKSSLETCETAYKFSPSDYNFRQMEKIKKELEKYSMYGILNDDSDKTRIFRTN